MKRHVSFFLLCLTLSSYLFAGGEIELHKCGNYYRGIVGGETKIRFHQRRTGIKGIIDSYPVQRLIQEDPNQAAECVCFVLKTMRDREIPIPKVVTVLYCSEEECQGLESSGQYCSHVQKLKEFYERF